MTAKPDTQSEAAARCSGEIPPDDCEMQEATAAIPESSAAAIPDDAKRDPPGDLRSFERFLRDAGFTRAQAMRIALHGFPARDGDEPLAALLRRNLEVMTNE